MRNRDLLEGMRRDLDVWIKFPERPPGIYKIFLSLIILLCMMLMVLLLTIIYISLFQCFVLYY